MSLPLDVVSGPFAETAVVSLPFFVRMTDLPELKQSLLQKVIFRQLKHCNLHGKNCWMYSSSNSRRRRSLEMLLQQADSSSYSPPSDGKLKAYKHTPLSLLTWFVSDRLHLQKVSLLPYNV